MKQSDLVFKKCKPCEGGVAPLSRSEAEKLLADTGGLEGWTTDGERLVKEFKFKNYYPTIAFVNAVAWIAHQEDHHPELVVGYNSCKITYATHAIGGLSENDFICAAKVNQLGVVEP